MSRGPSTWSPGQRQGFWGTAKQQRPLGILLQGQNTHGVRSKAGQEMGMFWDEGGTSKLQSLEGCEIPPPHFVRG